MNYVASNIGSRIKINKVQEQELQELTQLFILLCKLVAAERMRIDSSGNLLIGKTTGASATAGHRFNPNGSQESTASGTQPLYLNRLSSDGNIIVFDKDNSTVGSVKNFQSNEQVGLTSSKLYIFTR